MLLAGGQEGTVNVLLAIDNSTHSEAAVAAVKARFDPKRAAIRLLHVVEWPKNLAAPFSFTEGPSTADCILAVHAEMRKEGQHVVMRARQQLEEAGFDVTAMLDEGDVRRVILSVAAEWPADLIVLGSHGRTGFIRLLLGSVSEGIVRHAPCSVEIVRERRENVDRDLAAAS